MKLSHFRALFIPAIAAFPLLLTPVYSYAQNEAEPVKVIVSDDGEADTIVVPVGEEESINFSAMVNHDPVINQEATLEGPKWTWSPSGGELTSNGPSATVTFKFDAPGIYTVSASATATYKTKYGQAPNTVYGDDIIITGEPKSYTIKVKPKIWSTLTPVGAVWDENTHAQAKDGDGNLLFDGQITAPQDQTQSPALPANVYVEPGASVTCAINAVTDMDQWSIDANDNDIVDEDEKNYVADEVKYHWAGDGQFADANAQSTTWTAPTKPGTYSISCAPNDKWDGGDTGVTPPSTGTRNDGAGSTRNVQVIVLGVNSVSSDPEQEGEIMSGAIENDDHQITISANIGVARSGVKVHFEVTDNTTASIHAKISVVEAVTDADGIAQTVLTSSNTAVEGTVTVKAYAVGSDQSDAQSVDVQVVVPDNVFELPPAEVPGQ